jgi:glutaredoxin
LSAKTHVVLYTKPGCHLCGKAREQIRKAGCEEFFDLEEVNIETDPDLLAQYCYDIPVILIDGVEAFRHRLNSEEFRARVLQETTSS